MNSELSGAGLLDALERGEVRVAEPCAGGWQVNSWVKQGILEIFRTSAVTEANYEVQPAPGPSLFRDKSPLALQRFDEASRVRIVPGGSAVRRGAFLSPDVVCMPPMYVNLGAWIGPGAMIDSHALVGSCAQVGARVHLSAGAQLGGVLEPPGARPVIIEDDAFIGALSGVFEGVLVGAGAVLAGGLVLSATTPVYDLVHERELRGTREEPLVIPPGAVLLPGSRPACGEWAQGLGLQQSCGLIVKYRDASTDAATVLEEALR